MYQTSSQISGMVGGQMAMFANQSSYSQQIGGMVGTSPMVGGGGMQNPFPQTDTGARIAGGMGMALPGAATGLGIAGGLIGGQAGWLDPMTGVARGFAQGAGAGGLGFGGTLGHVGRTFMQGGMRAGMGVMAGGIGAAAATAVPYYLAGKAIQTVGENIYAGAQNVAQVGQMANQYFGTQYGQAGSRQGGQMGRNTIKGIVGVMQDLASDDVRTSMEDLKKVMDTAGRMGMLTGISNPQEFKQKFGKIVNQVQTIAKVMGSTLEEAAPMLQQMGQMGLWKTSDILGTAMTGRVAGAAAPQMMQAMQTGAQMSHAMGGTMRAGAMMGRESFMDIQAARRAGVLSQQDVMEFTGGVGGARGQQMMAQRMTGIMARWGEGSAGSLMMAGLGETEEGVFTGEIDKEKLARFRRGEISVNQLQRMGMQASRGREGAMSFFRQREKLSQNMASEGGMDSMMQIVQQVADTKFGGSEQARHQLIRQMFGVSNREAEMIGRMVDDMPRIKDQRIRQFEDAVNRAFSDAERRQNASWAGFKDAVGQMWDQSMRPLQDFGAKLATDIGSTLDKAGATLTGRTRRIAMGSMERTRLLRQGALTQDLSGVGPSNLGQDWLEGGAGSNVIRRMGEEGFGGRLLESAAQGAAGGALAGSLIPGLGTAAGGFVGGLAGAGAALFGAGEDMSPRARALRRIGVGAQGGGGPVDMGGGFTTSRSEMQQGIRRAFMRAQGGITRKNMSPAAAKAVDGVKSKMGSVLAAHSKALRGLNSADKQEMILEKLDGAGIPGWEGLSKREKLDAVAAAQKEEGSEGSDLSIDFKAAAKDLGMLPENPEELAKMQNDALAEMTEAAGGRNIFEDMLVGAGVGAVAGAGVFSVITAPIGAVVGGVLGASVDTGVDSEMMERIMTGPTASIMEEFMSGSMGKDEAKEAIAKLRKMGSKGNEALKIVEKIASGDEAAKKAFRKGGQFFGQLRMKQVGDKGRATIRRMAVQNVEEVAGLGAKAQEEFSALLQAYRGGADTTLTGEEYGEAAGRIGEGDRWIGGRAEELAAKLSPKQLEALRKGGGAIGRQVAAFGAIGDVGAMGKEDTQEFLAKMRQMGYDVEKFGGKDVEEVLKDKRVEAGEVDKLTLALKKMVGSGLVDTATGRKTAADRTLELLNLATDANTKFVNAVNQALDGKVADAHQQIQAVQNEARRKTHQLAG